MWPFIWKLLTIDARLYALSAVLQSARLGFTMLPGLIVREIFNQIAGVGTAGWNLWPLVALCVVLVVLLAWPRAWVARLVQLALLLGALEWLWTAGWLVQQRLALGQPWLRLACILGAVAVFTGASALVFRSAALRARYGRAATNPPG